MKTCEENGYSRIRFSARLTLCKSRCGGAQCHNCLKTWRRDLLELMRGAVDNRRSAVDAWSPTAMAAVSRASPQTRQSSISPPLGSNVHAPHRHSALLRTAETVSILPAQRLHRSYTAENKILRIKRKAHKI